MWTGFYFECIGLVGTLANLKCTSCLGIGQAIIDFASEYLGYISQVVTLAIRHGLVGRLPY